MEKTNYRNVYKSDYLGAIDLEEMTDKKQSLQFTISDAKQIKGANIAGTKKDANIIYFKEGIKPLVVNATNGKVLKEITGSIYLEDWKGTIIELYVDANVKMKGEVVGGVRIHKKKISATPQKPQFIESMFEKAKAGGFTMQQIEQSYSVSPEVKSKYLNYVAGN